MERPFHTDTAHYKRVKNRVIREIKAAKATYYIDKIHPSSKPIVDSDTCGLKKRNAPLPPVPCAFHLFSDLAAQEINDRFAVICQSILPLDPYIPAYLTFSSLPSTVQEAESVTKIRKLKQRSSATPNGSPIKIYKEFALEFATSLIYYLWLSD